MDQITKEMIEAAARTLAGDDADVSYGELVSVPEYPGKPKYAYFIDEAENVLKAALSVAPPPCSEGKE